MSEFKTLKGLYIKHVSSDPPSPIAGQIWYNTSSQTLKIAPKIAAWASGGAYNTNRYGCGGFGPVSAALICGGNLVTERDTYMGGSRNGTQTACRTTGGAFTATLPAGTIGDEISFIDYAGTFDSNNLTVAANGSEKIHASTGDLTVTVERAAFTLVFTDSTQGWLLKDK